MVCKECWEPRHPQDFLRGVPDDPSVPWTRPDEVANTNSLDISGNPITSINVTETNGDIDKTLIPGTHSVIQNWNTTLSQTRGATLYTGFETSHGNFGINDTSSQGGVLSGWNWSANPGSWEISGGKARHVGSGVGTLTALGPFNEPGIFSDPLNAVSGQQYELKYTIEDDSILVVNCGGATQDITATPFALTPGSYTYTVEATSSLSLLFFVSKATASSAKISNVSVKKVGAAAPPDAGKRFHIYRTDGSNKFFYIGPLNNIGAKRINLTMSASAVVEYTGFGWDLIDYYTLGL